MLGQFDRLQAILGQINHQAGILQQATRDFLIDRFVFGQQDASAGVFVEQPFIGSLSGKNRRWQDGIRRFAQPDAC